MRLLRIQDFAAVQTQNTSAFFPGSGAAPSALRCTFSASSPSESVSCFSGAVRDWTSGLGLLCPDRAHTTARWKLSAHSLESQGNPSSSSWDRPTSAWAQRPCLWKSRGLECACVPLTRPTLAEGTVSLKQRVQTNGSRMLTSTCAYVGRLPSLQPGPSLKELSE